MENPCAGTLEVLGMMVGVVAWLCSLAATLMPSWLTLSTELLAVESYEKGLWESCVVQEVAGTECRSFDTILGLSFGVALAQVLTCLSDALGALGLVLAVPGLGAVRGCGGRRVKRGIKVAAGALLLAAGALVIAAVSLVAHDAVRKFFDESVPHTVPRWEFGDALFVGWAAGVLHTAAALLLFFSCCPGSEEDGHRREYRPPHPENPGPPGLHKERAEYV